MSDFLWVDKYPKDIPAQISDSKYQSLLDLFDNGAKMYGNDEAFENMGTSLTYSQIDDFSTNFAAYLQNECQLGKGDRIALQMPNMLQYPVVLIGALKAGLIVVNTNPLYTAREMEHQFNDADVRAIVVIANFASSLESILHKTKIEHVIITKLGDLLGGFKGGLINLVVKHVKKMIPYYNLPTAVKFNDVLKRGEQLTYNRPEINGEDTAFLQYTGGTTGVSKGAMLSHNNIISHTSQLIEWCKPLLGKKEVVITAIPLYHIFALTVNGIFLFDQGAKNILITNPRDMKGFVAELKKHKFTIMTGVNTLFIGMLNNVEFKNVDFSFLKVTIGGGMAVQDFVAKKWKEVTKSTLCEGYGLSETSPVLCCNPLDGSERIGTIGLPTPSTEVGIFDDDGKQLAQGEVGEICGRGPQVMSGYWKKDNQEVFFDGGWLKTGDIGLMDKYGFFKIVDRKKDMICVSGFNVYPNEVENVISNHEKVLEVAVIGVADAKSTEAVKAFIVKADDTLTKEEVKTYCEKNLTGYKKPKHIEFRADLPKSNVGKILRRILKEETATE